MKYRKRWFTRKIRKGGRVKMGGDWYTIPTIEGRIPYDGRLDGLTATFSLYTDCYGEYNGTAYYHSTKGYEDEPLSKDPKWINGVSYWDFWKREGEQ